MGSLAMALECPEVLTRTQDETHCAWIIGGRFRVERQLGRGGAATVQRALDLATGGKVALKQLHRDATRAATLGFRREFHTLTSLKHPNIVEVHDFGVDARGPFYSMELLDTDLLKVRRLEPIRVCQLLLDIGAALAFLHSRRLIHGDISRRNIGFSEQGVAKLLDFGLLATVGEMGNGKGTLPYMPPEVARKAPTDHRADIFSLGALAYSLLTGYHAFPAQNGKELEKLWCRRPASPNQTNKLVSDELGNLVVSMLSIDPLGRPSSAAEVIDRVRALHTSGGTTRRRTSKVSRVKVQRGYLSSSALVGRKREMTDLRNNLAQALEGRGGAVLVEAPSGLGKSRLLKELSVEAQMAGAHVLSVRCETTTRSLYGVLYNLVRGLLRSTTPDDGLTVMGVKPQEDKLPALLRWVGEEKTPSTEVTRKRIQLQRLLAARLLAEARHQTLVVLVDDLQRCDEASAAVLATLAHQAGNHSLLLLCSCRTDEPVLAPLPVEELRRQATPMPLAGLSARAVGELVRAIFGDVEHVERLAKWMHQAGDGSPLRCSELARHLVEQGRARYEDGVWRIPKLVGQAALPPALRDAMTARVSGIGVSALMLAEAAAIHGGEMTLELCVGLSDAPDESEAFAALNELVEREVLVGGGEKMRFAHDGIREAVLAGMSQGRRRELHLRVGQILARTEGPSEAVGWHLLKGGKEIEGANILVQAGQKHFRAQSFIDAVAPLEAALDVFDRHDTDTRLRCEIRQDLVRAGTVCDRQVALRHGSKVLCELREAAGLDLASRMQWLGKSLALFVAVVAVWFRRLFRRRSRRGPPVGHAFSNYLSMVNYMTSVRALSFDLEGVRKMPTLFEPIPHKSLAYRMAYCLCSNLELILTGRWEDAGVNAERYLKRLPILRRLVRNKMDLQMGEGAMRYMLAFVTANRQGPRCLNHLRRLESTELQFLEVSAKVGRILFHRLRGEEALAQQLEEEAKLLMVQVGSMWLWESQLTWISAIGHCFTGNLPALRRSIEELEQLLHRGVQVEPFLELSRGVYQAERGDVEEARRGLYRLLRHPGCRDNPLIRQAALCILARTLLAQDDREGAAAVARQCMQIARSAQTGFKMFLVHSSCTRALADARGGDFDKAVSRILPLLDQLHVSPFLHGTCHETLVEVALCARDVDSARTQLQETDRWFRATGNPALAARVERLAAKVNQHVTGGNVRHRRMTEMPTIPWQV